MFGGATENRELDASTDFLQFGGVRRRRRLRRGTRAYYPSPVGIGPFEEERPNEVSEALERGKQTDPAKTGLQPSGPDAKDARTGLALTSATAPTMTTYGIRGASRDVLRRTRP